MQARGTRPGRVPRGTEARKAQGTRGGGIPKEPGRGKNAGTLTNALESVRTPLGKA